MNTVIAYHNIILPSTQTFFKNQMEALTGFMPVYVGLGPAKKNLDVPPPTLLTTDRSIISKIIKHTYMLTGIAPKFHRAVSALAPSLVHAHFPEDAATALPLVRHLGVPFVVTLHGSVETMPNKFLRRQRDGLLYLANRKRLWDCADLFICVSDFIKKKASEIGFPEKKLFTHYIGIDVEMFRADGGQRQRDMVVFVGRLVEQKGCQHLLRALSLLREKHPKMEAIIIGDGPYRATLVAVADQLSINCRFLGHQSPEQVRAWLCRARVLCAPSITGTDGNSEGLPTVICEAQASGVPVVSTYHAGIPEIITHGDNGLLAQEGDVSALAAGIDRVLLDDDFWNAASRSGVARIRNHFDLTVQTRKLERIYQWLDGPRNRPLEESLETLNHRDVA